MLFSPDSHPGLADGSITRTFRTWKRAQARPGARHRVGGLLLEIDAVRQVPVADLTDADAQAAGERDLAALRKRLGSPDPAALVWRVDLHHVGPDDRIALRAADELTPADIDGLRARLDRLDAAADRRWTLDTLRLIAIRPAVVSTELAAALGRERAAFKVDVRKLKNLGLTESLPVGYRLSPRGLALVRALDASPGPLPIAGLVDELQARIGLSRRYLVGLTGPPGAGKSVLAGQLARAWDDLGRSAAVVGLDGFHLSARDLARRGLAGVKGAPETFDPDGFVDLLRRLRTEVHARVPAPGFDRDREQTLPAAGEVAPGTELVLVEGNYLLLDGPWRPVRALLDLVWYLDVPDTVRVARLVARHVGHGRTPEEASAWVHRSDEANARRIGRTRHRADAFVDVRSGSLRRADTIRV